MGMEHQELRLTACAQAVEAAALVPGLDSEAEPGWGGCQQGGGADIVVATPGRLVAHLQGTPGFGLAGLQFLVGADVARRLLRALVGGSIRHHVVAATRRLPASRAEALMLLHTLYALDTSRTCLIGLTGSQGSVIPPG